MNYNPSPREDFIKSPANVKAHHAQVESQDLRTSLFVALLEYHRRQTRLSSPDLGGCAACHLRSQGAQEFVDLFLNLCETQQVSPRTDVTNLPGNVSTMPKAKN